CAPEFRALIRRLALHRWAEIVAGYSVGKAWKVLDFLDADQMATGDIVFQDECREAVARGEQASSKTGEAGADDYDIIVGHVSLKVPIVHAVQPLRSVQSLTSFLPRDQTVSQLRRYRGEKH